MDFDFPIVVNSNDQFVNKKGLTVPPILRYSRIGYPHIQTQRMIDIIRLNSWGPSN